MHVSIETIEHDIGVIKFDREIEYNDNIRTACLPDGNVCIKPGTVCVVVGWGCSLWCR